VSATVVDRATELLEMIEGKWTTQAIGVAAELCIADHIAAGTDRADTLAAATSSDGDAIERLLRALASLGICTQRPDHSYGLTALGALLRDEGAGSLRSWAVYSARYHWPTWGKLIDSVRTGKSARVLLGGVNGYGHFERDAGAADTFNRGLGGLTYIVGLELARSHDFVGARCVMDIGGGEGQLLAAILATHPALHGILFDLAHAIDRAPPLDRCERRVGDFFAAIPADADVYVMQSILHNWHDEDCVRVLAQCRRALGAGGRLLLVERVLPETLRGDAAERPLTRSDLNMLVGFSGRERTLAGFDALLDTCGLTRRSHRALALGYSVIEAS
jgi:orsellinic acid C2-O-methyltransferase